MTSESQFSLEVNGGTFHFNDSSFDVSKQMSKPTVNLGTTVGRGNGSTKVPLLNVLWAHIAEDKTVVVSVLVPNKTKWALKHIQGELLSGEENFVAAEKWAVALMELAYVGLKRARRLRVLINPVGGKGKARAVYDTQVKPIFDAARCVVEMTITDHQGHMIELAEKMSLDFDAVVVLSGDGGVHEVINGLSKHSDANKALRIPIAQIPTGSANAVCINTLGPKHGFNVAKACLNVIKGKSMKQNIYSISQGNRKCLSFLSTAAGLMADLDLETEHLRWMGDTRFIVGYLQGVVSKKRCPIEVEYKLVDDDKHRMAANARENATKTHFHEEGEERAATEEDDDTLPWHKPVEEKEEGWIKYDKPIIYLFAGGMPFVARDLMQFPLSTPSDGSIDLVIQTVASRSTMLKATIGAEKGEQYWIDSQSYMKVSALRIKPTGRGNLSIDGEMYPFEAFELKVHPGILRFLSLHGRYIADDFDYDRVHKKAQQQQQQQAAA